MDIWKYYCIVILQDLHIKFGSLVLLWIVMDRCQIPCQTQVSRNETLLNPFYQQTMHHSRAYDPKNWLLRCCVLFKMHSSLDSPPKCGQIEIVSTKILQKGWLWYKNSASATSNSTHSKTNIVIKVSETLDFFSFPWGLRRRQFCEWHQSSMEWLRWIIVVCAPFGWNWHNN